MIFINPVTALKKLKTCSEELPPPGIMQTKNNRQQYNSEMVWLDFYGSILTAFGRTIQKTLE